tara:strand:- start:452 stop:793 length:342 start_codon:yes stop_codon:yes gene_type:complete
MYLGNFKGYIKSIGYFKKYKKNIRTFKRYKIYIRYGLWIIFAVLLFNGQVNQFSITVLALTQVFLNMISRDFNFYEKSNNSKVNGEQVDIGSLNITSFKSNGLKKGQNWSDGG